MKKNLSKIILSFFKVPAAAFLTLLMLPGLIHAEEKTPEFRGKAQSFAAAHRVFEVSCLPCHSASQPLSWYGRLVVNKKEFRKALSGINLDETIYLQDQAPSLEALNKIEAAVMSKKMPPHDYIIRDVRARLSKKEKKAILDWISDERARYEPQGKKVEPAAVPGLKPLKSMDTSFAGSVNEPGKEDRAAQEEDVNNPFKPRSFKKENP